MKNYAKYILIIIVLIITPIIYSTAQSPDDEACQPPQILKDGVCQDSPTANYKLLAPITTQDGKGISEFNASQNNALGGYLNMMLKIFIGLCAVLAVVMIVMGGMEYMTSELISNKEDGKNKITGALFGLLIALGAYALLNTINPDLLKSDVDIPTTTLTVLDKDIIIVRNGKVSAGDGSGAINQNSVNTTCDARSVMSAAQAAGTPMTEGQAATFSCLISKESGCRPVKNYNWGSGSSAYGPYQILLQTHSDCFENKACYAASGAAGPLKCSTGFRGGNPIGDSRVAQQCIKAASDFTCSTGAAMCVYKKQGFSAWTADSRNTKQKECITKYNY